MAEPSSPATKWCYDCGSFKPLEAFAFHNKAKGTLQARCRACHAKYRREHYVRNRETYIAQEVARIDQYRIENRPRIREYLRAHPCVDCGEIDIVVLDFDHRDPAAKEYSVTVLAAHKSWVRVLAEIEKCDVRCSNCHRRRTALQFDWGSRGRRPSKTHSEPILNEINRTSGFEDGSLGEKKCVMRSRQATLNVSLQEQSSREARLDMSRVHGRLRSRTLRSESREVLGEGSP